MRRIWLPPDGTETVADGMHRLKDLDRRALRTLAGMRNIDRVLPNADDIRDDVRRSLVAAHRCIAAARQSGTYAELCAHRDDAETHLQHASLRIERSMLDAKEARSRKAVGYGKAGGRGNIVGDKAKQPGVHKHAAAWSILVDNAIAKYQLTIESACKVVARSWKDDKGKTRNWTTIRDHYKPTNELSVKGTVEFHAILTRHFHPILTHPYSSPEGSRCG